jgi:coenzyme F420-reducing hydrogenase gamma subunit
MRKLKVGFFSFTGDEGCMIQFLEILNRKFAEWNDLLDIQYCRLLRSKNRMKGLDVAFVEGAVATYREEKSLKDIRKNSKKIVAIGSCAIDGTPSNLRNFFDEEKLKEIKNILEKFGHRKKVLPLKEFVKVDAEVEGCPMDEEAFIKVLNKYLKEFKAV